MCAKWSEINEECVNEIILLFLIYVIRICCFTWEYCQKNRIDDKNLRFEVDPMAVELERRILNQIYRNYYCRFWKVPNSSAFIRRQNNINTYGNNNVTLYPMYLYGYNEKKKPQKIQFRLQSQNKWKTVQPMNHWGMKKAHNLTRFVITEWRISLIFMIMMGIDLVMSIPSTFLYILFASVKIKIDKKSNEIKARTLLSLNHKMRQSLRAFVQDEYWLANRGKIEHKES